MRKILFVDDESRLLDGLRRMLRPMREQWEMSFASGGDEALQLLAIQPFDVLVTDMKMPGMNGPALLTEVMQRYPSVVRIVLSGESSRDEAMRAVGAAHQFLSKPCEPTMLKKTIDRAFKLRRALQNESLERLLTQIKTLPSMPALYQEIIGLLQTPDASTRGIGELIAKDAGMSAKLLQLVNSSFFGIGRHVTNPVDAATLLGTDTVRSLVLSIGIFSEIDIAQMPGFDVDAVWLHSMKTGALAKQIAQSEKVSKVVAEDSTMAGLLHDVGKLVLAQHVRDPFARAVQMARLERIPLSEAECGIFGTSHADVGGYLLGLWSLPDTIVEAVALHHRPQKSPVGGFTPLTAVHVANALEHESRNPGTEPSPPSQLDMEYLARLDLEDRLPSWRSLRDETLSRGVMG